MNFNLLRSLYLILLNNWNKFGKKERERLRGGEKDVGLRINPQYYSTRRTRIYDLCAAGSAEGLVTGVESRTEHGICWWSAHFIRCEQDASLYIPERSGKNSSGNGTEDSWYSSRTSYHEEYSITHYCVERYLCVMKNMTWERFFLEQNINASPFYESEEIVEKQHSHRLRFGHTSAACHAGYYLIPTVRRFRLSVWEEKYSYLLPGIDFLPCRKCNQWLFICRSR